jgi:hypothetical protein
MRAMLALVAIASLLTFVPPVHAQGATDCMGCDAIIAFCEKHFHTQCVESAGPQCAISLCQDIDRICARWGAHCVA